MMHFLHQIQKFLKSHRLTPIEQKRITDELDGFWERLRKRKYKMAYTTANQFHIPERTREFYEHLKYYASLGEIWARILKDIHIERFPQVVEICPGYAPKIALALVYVDYRGELMLLDKKMSSMRQLEQFLQIFHTKFNTKKKKLDLFQRTGQTYDIILGNHIMDDLILTYFCRKWHIREEQIYEKEGRLIEMWQRILQKRNEHMKEILPSIAGIFEKMTKRGGVIIFSHYKSYIEKLLDLSDASRFTKELIRQVLSSLSQKGFSFTAKRMNRGFEYYIVRRA